MAPRVPVVVRTIAAVIVSGLMSGASGPSSADGAVQQRWVKGTSLEPMVPEGSRVTLRFDPERRQPIARGDLVAFAIGGREVPLLKVVYGVPGDRLAFVPAIDRSHHLVINGKLARNSQGVPYRIGGKRYQMLALYVRDYQGIIPDDAYLVLGDEVGGSRDSTQIGLVGRSSIIGKVVEVGPVVAVSQVAEP